MGIQKAAGTILSVSCYSENLWHIAVKLSNNTIVTSYTDCVQPLGTTNIGMYLYDFMCNYGPNIKYTNIPIQLIGASVAVEYKNNQIIYIDLSGKYKGLGTKVTI